MKDDGPDRLRFEQAGPRAAYLLVSGIGAIIAVGWGSVMAGGGAGGLVSVVALLAPVAAGGVMVAVGLRGLRRGFPAMVFDRQRGVLWQGRQDPAEVAAPDSIPYLSLDRAYALQLLSQPCQAHDAEFVSYELNLVLDDASRMQLVAHANRRQMREDAGRLARFLDVPLWDRTR